MSLETNNFAFGEFFLDTNEKVLFRDNKPVAITPKAFQLLHALVRDHGHLVEKRELIDRVWPGSFVEEGNLTFTIGLLRKALGDDSHDPRFIETVARRGYRFVAEVTAVETTDPRVSDQKLPQKRSWPRWAIVACCLIFIGILTGGIRLARTKFKDASASATILDIPFHSEKFSNSGKKVKAAISPDGRLAAYVDETDGKLSVWLRDLQTAQNTLIVPPGNELYFGIVFSHDGQSIYFVRRSKSEPERTATSIYRVSARGGVPEKIIGFAEGWISLSPDDQQISFVRCEYKDDDYCSLMIADINGQNERRIVARPRPLRISDNQFSPDGKSIAFASGVSENGGRDFRITKVDLATGTESAITGPQFFDIRSLKWLPSGDALIVSAMEMLDGQSKLWHVSAETGEALELTKDSASYMSVSLSSDATKMITTRVENNFQLYISSHEATKMLTGAREAVFTPGGKIVYSTDGGDIWIINRDGGEQRQLTSNAYRDFSPCVSPDGRFIYFTSARSGSNQIWRMNADGSDQTQITKTEGGYPVFVSPDGRWVYYESGLHETLWKVAADTHEEIKVSDNKVYRPAFSPDGDFVAYFFGQIQKSEKLGIAVMAIPEQTIKTLVPGDPQAIPVMIAWSNNRTLTYVSRSDQSNSLWTQSLDEPTPHLSTNLGDKQAEFYSLGADGAYLYTRGEWLYDAILIDGLK